MSIRTLLLELEDIPITTHNPKKKDSQERVEPRKQEADTNVGFTLSNFNLKTGKLRAGSEKELDTKVDKFLKQTANRMGMVFNYSTQDDTFVAFVVYYDRDVSNFEGKYEISLKNKIESFAKNRSKGDVQPKLNKNKTINNIQQTLEKLSEKSLQDILGYAKALVRKETNDYTS